MESGRGVRRNRGWRRAAAAIGAATTFLLLGPPPGVLAAGTPVVLSSYTEKVEVEAATLKAQVDSNEVATTYFFQYTPATSYQEKGFTDSLRVPVSGEKSLGAKNQNASERISALKPASAYRFRVVAKNEFGTTNGPPRLLTTDEVAPKLVLPDARGWELVSPIEKNGGQVDNPESAFGGGVFQAAAQGGAVTYTSLDAFAGPAGSPGASQYLSRRSDGGWSTANLTVSQYSGGYDTAPGAGAPYRLFSADLALGLSTNGRRCRGEGLGCPVANPPLPGSGAPAGYRNYYLRDNGSGGYKALLTSSDAAGLALGPDELELSFAAATPDLTQIVLSSCAALTTDATETSGTGGECDAAEPNLYRYSASGLKLINLLPGDTQGSPGAAIAAQGGAISSDGSRVFFVHGGNLYLRAGSQSFQVDESLGGGGTFQAASSDGSVAYFSKGEHLYRYLATTKAVTDLTPAGELLGVLGANPDGSYVYYQTAAGLFLSHAGSTTPVPGVADASNFPPATGTARVSADGQEIVFLSAADLTDFGAKGNAEVYLFSIASGLRCISCNPSGELPLGPSGIPGAVANGDAFRAYKPRVLSAAGTRIFFESPDPLVTADGNRHGDVYQWEANATGGCVNPNGCLNLISSGDEATARFIDASASGDDAFFTSDGSLVADDPGAVDIYDARVGGGFPAFEPPIVCSGDSCQSLPGEPEDPTPATVLPGPGNPPLHLPNAKPKKKKHKHHKRKGSRSQKKRSKQGGGRR